MGIKSEIAHYTYDYQGSKEVMGVVLARLGKQGQNWRMVFKALQLLDYLVKNGHERVANMAREQQYLIRSLGSFHYIDEEGRDRGNGIRTLSKELAELLEDWNALRELRQDMRKSRKKFKNIANTGFGSSGGNYNTGDYDSGGKWNDDWRDSKKKSESRSHDDDSSKKKKKKKK